MLDYYSILNNKNTIKLYLDRYLRFITIINNLGNRNLDYTEEHHIIPRCINKSYYNHIENRIKLTAREHYIAHRLFAKCYIKGSNEYNRSVHALFAMSKLNNDTLQRDDIKMSSRVYERLRKAYAEVMHDIQVERMKTGHWDNFIGKGKPSTIKGKISITNGNINRYIDPTDEIPDGWYRGSTQKRSHLNHSEMMTNAWKKNKVNRIGKNHPMYGKGDLLRGNKNGRYGVELVYMNNGIKNKMVKPNEVDNYIKNGYVKGRIKKKR